MDTSVFALTSFVLSVLAYIPYVWGVLKSETRPTISTWISWGLMDLAILVAMIAQHDVAPQMIAFVVGTAVVIAVSLYKGASVGWKQLDTVCTLIVVAAIAAWAVTGDPEAAIVSSLVAATVGTIPMMTNTWQDPENEKLAPWLIVFAGGVFGILAIRSWTITGASTQIVFALLQGGMIVLICRKFRYPMNTPFAKWFEEATRIFRR